jgi:DNA-binding beta-propeller fold protein YncE
VFTPDGKHILAGGIVATSDGGYDYALLRYGAADGVFSWARRYRGVRGYSEDFLTSIAMAPDGATVFVTGYGSKGTDTADYATVAYDPDSGVQKWVKRFNAGGTDQAESLAVDPTGTKVYVSGQSEGTVSGFDFVTLTYDASMGTKLGSWRYGPGSDVTDLTLVNGSLVIAGLGSYSGDPSGAGLTARFPA